MKYVCKKKISYCDRIKYGMPYIIEVKPGDILEYVGIDERCRFEFVTNGGDHIFIWRENIDDWFEEMKESDRDKLIRLLGHVCKIEADVAGFCWT